MPEKPYSKSSMNYGKRRVCHQLVVDRITLWQSSLFSRDVLTEIIKLQPALPCLFASIFLETLQFPLFLILFIYLFFTLQMTIKGRKLALLLLLVVALEILLFAGSDANPWWRRRRRRRCSSFRPSSAWVNDWGKDFNVRCRTGKKSCYQFCYLTYVSCFICAYFHMLVQHAHRMNNY